MPFRETKQGGFLPASQDARLSEGPEDSTLSDVAKVGTVVGIGAGLLAAPLPTLGAMVVAGGGALAADKEGREAAFRTENTIGSSLADKSGRYAGRSDPDYDPWDDIGGTEFEPYWDNFADSRSAEHSDLIKQDIIRERKDREYLESQGMLGFAQSMAAGIFDLPSLLPGGAVVRTAKGASKVRTALKVGAFGTAGAGITEGVLQGTQELRTPEESAMNIAGATILSGVLGYGMASRMNSAEMAALGKRVEKDFTPPDRSSATPSTEPQPSIPREMDDLETELRQVHALINPHDDSVALQLQDELIRVDPDRVTRDEFYAIENDDGGDFGIPARRGLSEEGNDVSGDGATPAGDRRSASTLSGEVEATPKGGRTPVSGTETFPIKGFTGIRTGEIPAPGRIAARVYRVYPEGVKVNRLKSPVKSIGEPLGELRISQHEDGRWEVGDVEIGESIRRQKVATRLYDQIEADLGIKMRPSGHLFKDGYAFWKNRNADAVKYHRFSDMSGEYLSPRQIRNSMNRLDEALAKGRDEPEELIEAMTVERAELQSLWDELPADVKTKPALDQMFALSVKEEAELDRVSDEMDSIFERWGEEIYNIDDLKAKISELPDDISKARALDQRLDEIDRLQDKLTDDEMPAYERLVDEAEALIIQRGDIFDKWKVGSLNQLAARTKKSALAIARAEQLQERLSAFAAKDQSSDDEMFSLRGFYSPAIRAAEQLKQNKGTGEQFWKQITKAPGVRKDELEWMGLEEFLAGKKSITRDEVLDFMKAHQVELDEKVLGGEESSDLQTLAFERFNDDFSDRSESFNEWLYDAAHTKSSRDAYVAKHGDDAFEDADPVEIIREVEGDAALSRYRHEAWAQFQNDYMETAARDIGQSAIDEGAENTKFGQYKVPGGENYRELLIRLPEFEAKSTKLGDDEFAQVAFEPEKYVSPHFNDQEIVHLRVDDRTGPNGEKVLFINEVQSDLHQKGRKKGYAPMSEAEINQRREQIMSSDEWLNPDSIPKARQDELYAELERLATLAENVHGEAPNAPFKGDLWLELALKRALLYAAENGYDSVSWARSDQIAKAVGGDAEALSVQYDQKIGRFLNKYTKKWGGKVERTEIDEFDDASFEARLRQAINGTSDENIKDALRNAQRLRASGTTTDRVYNAMPTEARRAFADTWGENLGNPILHFTPEMRASVMEGQPFGGLRRNQQGEMAAEAKFEPEKQLITISRAALDPVNALHHEAVHALKSRGLFSPKEWALIDASAKSKGWLDAPEIKDYQRIYGRSLDDESIIEEAFAMAYQRHVKGDEIQKGALAKIFDRITAYLERIANYVRSRGFNTAEDIFRAIEQGDIGARAGGGRRTDATATGFTAAGAASSQEGDIRLKGALGTEKKLAFLSPSMRLQNSPARSARAWVNELAETALTYEDHKSWIPTARGGAELGQPGSVETRVKLYDTNIAAGFKALDNLFIRYRKGSSKRIPGDLTVTSLRDATAGPPAGKMNYREFREAVSASMRRGDEHDIPEVAEAAKTLRKEVFEPLLQRAIELEMLPEDVTPETAASYLNRIYNKERIVAERTQFRDVITKWLQETELHNAQVRGRVTGLLDEFKTNQGKLKSLGQKIARRTQRLTELERAQGEIGKLNKFAFERLLAKIERQKGATPEEIDTVVGFWEYLKEFRKQSAPQSLVQFVVSRGGVEDRGGDVLSMIGRKKDRPGLIRKSSDRGDLVLGGSADNAYTLDAVALAAWENGFFPHLTERPTINEFLDALGDDISGDHIFRGDDQGYSENLAYADEIQQELESYGISLNQFRSEEVLRDYLATGIKKGSRKDSREKGARAEAGVYQGRIARRGNVLADQISGRRGELESLTFEQSNRTARQNEISKLIEEQIELYQGKSADEAKSALKSRSKTEEGREADADRLASADKAVMRAAKKIAAQTEKENIELVDTADQIIDRILGTPEGRLPYDAGMNKTANRNFGGVEMDARGPLAARQFMIPDARIEQWLENDVDLMIRAYVHTMAPDIELTARFGSPDMVMQFKQINEEYAKMAAATDDPKIRKRLHEQKKEDFLNLGAIRDRLRGTYALPENPDAISVRAIRGMMTMNYMRMLGGMTISALPDVSRFIHINGVMRTFGDGIIPMFRGFSKYKKAGDETKWLSGALELVTDNRAMRIADITDSFGRHTKFERGLQAAGRQFGIVSLMAPWNAVMKQLAGTVTQTRILRGAEKLFAGKPLKQKDIEYFADLGISEGALRQIGEQFKKHGHKESNVWSANTAQWDEGSRAAIEALRVGLRKEADKTIITPSFGERPRFASTLMGAFLLQFKSFAISATQKMLISGLQQKDLNALNGAVLAVALGGMVHILKGAVSGRDVDIDWGNDEDMKQFLGNAFDRSGMAGVLMEFNNISEKVTDGRVGLSALTGKPISRYASRNVTASLLGPGFGLAEDSFNALNAALGTREWKERDSHNVRQLMPLNNLFYLRSVFDNAEKGLNEALGVPAK